MSAILAACHDSLRIERSRWLFVLLLSASLCFLLAVSIVAKGETEVSWSAPLTFEFDHHIDFLDGEVWAEIGKQTVEQPLHFLMTAGPIALSRYLVGVPWYGWAIAPVLAYREWSQWPSRRWWDPPLDWAALVLGAVVATWRRGARHRRKALRISRRGPRSSACV